MSLRRAPGVTIESSGFWRFRRHRVHASATLTFELDDGVFRRAQQALATDGAARIGVDGDRVLWWTRDGFHWAEPRLGAADIDLLVWDRRRRQDAQLERLRTIRAREEAATGARRERIPDDVRAFVWARDDGRCVRCGAEDDLQFDHVIPVAKGGGNAPANVQLLCGACNRAKSDAII